MARNALTLHLKNSAAILAVSCLAFAISLPARADEDPFEMQNHHWMSFEHYKEKSRGGANFDPSAAPAETIETPTVDNNANPDANVHFADGAGAAPATATPVVAAPTREINVPVMPGLNKGYNINITTTEDTRAPVAQITHMDSEPTLALPAKNWQSTADAIHNKDKTQADDEDHPPLDVRMTFLPNRQIKPTPPSEPEHNHGRAPNAVAIAQKPPEKPATDPAACAAVDAYKQRQLDAIESDRQTLTALQNAIKQLGLQKELSFMSGSGSKMNTQAQNGPQIEVPSLAGAAKN